MPPALDDWDRPRYRSGGGDAMLFYVAYGPVPEKFTISASKYRFGGIPAGLEMMSYGPATHPEVVDSLRTGYLWNELQKNDPELARTVSRQTECLVLRGAIPDPADLNYFRDTIGLLSWLCDCGTVAVYDPQMFQWWSPAQWQARAFQPAAAGLRNHVVILQSEDKDGTHWLHTRGMRKFGRPDLSVHGVTKELRNGLVDLCNRFIEYQALGGIIKEGQEIDLRSLPAGMKCFHRGDLDDPDFNNVHVEIGLSAG